MKKTFFSLLFFCPVYLFAQWNSNPSINTPVCTATGNQGASGMRKDAFGGTFITWRDQRNSTWDIYLQRLDSNGVALWPADGIAICLAPGNQSAPYIASDGSGGCILLWADNRNGSSSLKIYGQRVDASGAIQWTADGINLTGTTPGITSIASISVAPDNSGGVIFTWVDNRNGSNNPDVFAQRVDANGNVLWNPGGVSICTATGYQMDPALVVDSGNNTIVAWGDSRSSDQNIYAQKVNATGSVLWSANGIPVSQAIYNQAIPKMISDQHNGVVLSWMDGRAGPSQFDIYAQHIDSSGNMLWTANGIPVNSGGKTNMLAITEDNTGGAIITWYDSRNFATRYNDIYAQRLSAAGVTLWTNNGVLVSGDSLEESFPIIESDGNYGAVIVWNRSPISASRTIKGQRVDSNGVLLWGSSSISITTHSSSEFILTRANPANMIVSWTDARSGTSNLNVYATKLNITGTSPLPVDLISFTGQAKGSYNLLDWTTAGENKNKGFAIERSTDATNFREIGFIKGSGNVSQETTYHFTDEQPFNGKNFYRLKQMDADGKSKYSAVIELSNKRDAATFLYPNPAGDEIKVNTDQKEQLYIIDIYGRNILSAFTNQTINITSLKPGRYYCRLGATVLPFVKK